MQDDKKTETDTTPPVSRPAAPLAVQVMNAVIDGAAAIAKSVVFDTAERMAEKAKKTKVGKVAVALAERAEKPSKKGLKKSPKKPAAKKAHPKKAVAKKSAAKKRASLV
jgi:hypothetical protein